MSWKYLLSFTLNWKALWNAIAITYETEKFDSIRPDCKTRIISRITVDESNSKNNLLILPLDYSKSSDKKALETSKLIKQNSQSKT